MLQRQMTEWDRGCEIMATSLIPTRPGNRRKHNRKEGPELARLYRAGQMGGSSVRDGGTRRRALCPPGHGYLGTREEN